MGQSRIHLHKRVYHLTIISATATAQTYYQVMSTLSRSPVVVIAEWIPAGTGTLMQLNWYKENINGDRVLPARESGMFIEFLIDNGTKGEEVWWILHCCFVLASRHYCHCISYVTFSELKVHSKNISFLNYNKTRNMLLCVKPSLSAILKTILIIATCFGFDPHVDLNFA